MTGGRDKQLECCSTISTQAISSGQSTLFSSGGYMLWGDTNYHHGNLMKTDLTTALVCTDYGFTCLCVGEGKERRERG